MTEIPVPLKEIDGEFWLSFMRITDKAIFRAIGMENKPKRIQDEGKHHCFEIIGKGNIKLKPKKWSINIS